MRTFFFTPIVAALAAACVLSAADAGAGAALAETDAEVAAIRLELGRLIDARFQARLDAPGLSPEVREVALTVLARHLADPLPCGFASPTQREAAIIRFNAEMEAALRLTVHAKPGIAEVDTQLKRLAERLEEDLSSRLLPQEGGVDFMRQTIAPAMERLFGRLRAVAGSVLNPELGQPLAEEEFLALCGVVLSKTRALDLPSNWPTGGLAAMPTSPEEALQRAAARNAAMRCERDLMRLEEIVVSAFPRAEALSAEARRASPQPLDDGRDPAILEAAGRECDAHSDLAHARFAEDHAHAWKSVGP